MNGNFTKWIIGVLTLLLVGISGWAFTSITELNEENAVQQERIDRTLDHYKQIVEQLNRVENQQHDIQQTQKFILQNLK